MDGCVIVSVIMPAYNCERYIGEAIDSVLKQNMKEWELIIVDDCSKDRTCEIVRDYIHRCDRINLKCLSSNRGPQAARTEGIRSAVGKYIAFLDSDDIWKPDKLQKQVAFMEENSILMSATAYELINEDNQLLGTAIYPPEKCDYYRMLRLSNPLGNTTVMYNQEVLGKYEVPNIKKRNDFALWLRILRDVDFCYGMQEVLASYRERRNSVSSNKLRIIKYHWQLYHEIENQGFFKSMFYLACWAVVKGTGLGLDKRKQV